MRYLIAFGLLSLGAMIGVIIAALFTGRKLYELSEQISFHKARADELSEKLRRLEEWTKPMLPHLGALGKGWGEKSAL